MISDETMLEEKSFLLPLPPPTARKPRSPMKRLINGDPDLALLSPTRGGPSPRKGTQPNTPGDITLDIGDMMARVARPKRASGTEESFEDLLHADDLPEMDM